MSTMITNKKQVQENIKKLIEKYELSQKSSLIPKYTEEDTKKDFILPLFSYLGWDIADRNEVTAEESQSSGRVDYGFYLNSRAKFYLEAKSLKADLHREEYADQAIRYSWNKGVTWAVLTDFESLKVFNAQDVTKKLGDKLFFEIPYSKYIERFDQLWLLSKEAFEQNALDKKAEKYGKKLQRVSVGTLLYENLNECRDILTRDLSAWNDKVPKDLLDEGIQKLLDRLIFIRVAEDRGVEPPTLTPLIREWENRKDKRIPLYQSMMSKFREFDEIYNSNLFSPHPFEKWEDFSNATEKVVDILYGKKGYYEYDFKVIPTDVLGAVYENYLGYRLSQSRKGITLDEDARKRKEQGIYYTPDFIVEYIVNNSLKPVLDKCRSINDLKKIKVLDPACGSGSFLIKALEFIAEKYKEFNIPINELTKIQILQDNIYGVDLDEQAIEIARLNLLVNTLEQRIMLPSLTENIKNGNSLISGTEEELKKYFGKNFRDKKPFNWREEFPDVFKQGGFDVIIGNPPYIFTRGNIEENEKRFYLNKYTQTEFKLNTYILFIERSYSLLNERGSLGFIVPNNWLTLEMNSRLRKFILEKTFNIQILNVKDKVFGSASVDNCILFFTKTGNVTIKIGDMDLQGLHHLQEIHSSNFLSNHGHLITFVDRSGNEVINICKRISKVSVMLDEIAEVKNGVQAYTVGEGKPKHTEEMKESRVYHSSKKFDDSWKKYVDGVDVSRYYLGWSGQFIKYGENLSRQRKPELFKDKRILVRQIPAKLPYSIHAVYTDENLVNDNNSMIIKIKSDHKEYDIFYILGIINSRLISFWFNYTFGKLQRKIFPQFKINELTKFPIYAADKNQQKVIIDLVDKMIGLKNNLKNTEENSNKWIDINEEIKIIDRKIDEEVYKLYDLTPEEIKIVEKSSK